MNENVEITPVNSLKGKIVTIPKIDETLTQTGYGADAKVVGDKIRKIEEEAITKAYELEYDNEKSDLTSKDVQGAIDEIAGDYFSKSGGTIGGTVNVKSVENGYASVMKNHSLSDDYGTVVADVTQDGKSAKVSVSAALNLVTFTDSDNNIRDIHHEGNKPFGNYTGNGSATSRTIDTKGFGKLCMVYSSDYILFVTPKGALKVTLADSTIGWIASTNLHHLDGKLIMASSNEAFNKANQTYYYQVI